MAVSIDTALAVDNLQKVGVPLEHATAIVREIAENSNDFVTKSDLENALKAHTAELKLWVLMTQGGLLAVLFALLQLT